MIRHIDLNAVLRRTVCDLYSDLVTRPTGAAVRSGIEQMLADLGKPTLTVIDFSRVGLLDFSCADEIVAKLLLRYGAPDSGDAYFVFRGLSDSHLDAVEAVLGRHGLAIVAQVDGGPLALVGAVTDEERRLWDSAYRLGRGDVASIAADAGVDPEVAHALLESLRTRRLLMRIESCFAAPAVETA